MDWPVERTATRAAGQPDGVFSDLNFGEVFPFVAKPLVHDYLTEYLGPLLAAQMAGLRRDHPLSRELSPLAFVAGRPYMDLCAYVTIPTIAVNLDAFEATDHAKGAIVVALARAGRLRPLAMPLTSRVILAVAGIRLGVRSWRWLLRRRTPVKLLQIYREKTEELRALIRQPVAHARPADLLGDLQRRFQEDRGPTSQGLRHLAIAFVLHSMLQRLLRDRVPDEIFRDLGKGIPNNPTTEVSLDLWELAQEAQPLARLFSDMPLEELPQQLKATETGQRWWTRLEEFLSRHGQRGEVELDLATPRWRENPRFLLQTVGNYLKHPESSLNPLQMLEEGVRQREAAAATARAALAWPQRAVFNWLYQRYVLWMPFREAAKYTWLLGLEFVRKVYRELGRRLASEKFLDDPDDVFWLRLDELRAWASSGTVCWNPQDLKARRRLWQEWSLLRPPGVLVGTQGVEDSVNSTADAAATILHGTPVSSGQAEGIAKVVLNPHEAQLQKGEILVTRYTDPAWTPLFFTASALITEVGGMLSHGAVVAREVGLPAIVGVADATTRIRSGQRLRVNATEGTIELL